MDRVSMFRDKSRWDGWQQFGNEDHRRLTVESGEYEVLEFLGITPDEASVGIDAINERIQATGESSDAEASLKRKLRSLTETSTSA